MHILNTLPQRLDSGATPTFTGALFTDNITAPDLILGTSGPSAKSSIAARAARQGLVFDGTTRASYSIPAFGTGDFTASIWINQATLSNSAAISGPVNAFQLSLNRLGNGYLTVTNSGVGHVLDVNASASIQVGKFQLISCVRSSGTATFYVNGISVGSGAVATDFSAGCIYVGGALATAFVTGTISPLIYNRALSAAEVVSLYEAGVPAGSDYNNAGTTDIKPSAGTYAFWFGTGSISAATASSFTIAAGASSLAVRNVSGIFSAVTGKRYRATIVASGLTSAADFGSQGFTSNLSSGNISNGTNVIEFTATSTASGYFAISTISSTAGGSISISSIQALGLLLAPDAAQSGGGLVWYDTSGNAANITLPATGVSWNVPTSGRGLFADGTAAAPSISFANDTDTGLYLGGSGQVNVSSNGTGSLNFSGGGLISHPSSGASVRVAQLGNITLTAAGTNQNITLTPSGSGVAISSGVTQFNDTLQFNASGVQGVITWNSSNLYIRSGSSRSVSFQVNNADITVGQFLPSGRFLVGTGGVDSGALLQIGTNTTANTGGMVFGTDTFLFRKQAGAIVLDHASGNNPQIQLYESGVLKTSLQNFFGDFYIDVQTGKSLYLRTNGSTTALTIDSSQNATFAKTVTVTGGQVIGPAGTTGLQVYPSSLTGFGALYGDANATTGVTSYGSSHATKASKLEITAPAGTTLVGTGNNLTVNGTGTSTFAGAVAIGNTTAAAVAAPSTHKVSILIGGVQYYLLASNV